MASFYYYDQSPLGFWFVVQIRTFLIKTSLGFPNLNMKGKTKSILAVSSKMTLLWKWPITWNDELSMHVKTIFHFASTLNRRLNTFWHVLNTKSQILLVLRHQTSFPHFVTAVSIFFWQRLAQAAGFFPRLASEWRTPPLQIKDCECFLAQNSLQHFIRFSTLN